VSAFHQPVLVSEVCAAVLPALAASAASSEADPPVHVDCTCGGGGHLAAVLAAWGRPLRCLAVDRDPAALAAAAARPTLNSVEFVHAGFASLPEVVRAADLPPPTTILADLGVSSHQLDEGARGFSFQADAPLDMRMDPTRGAPLADVLADLDAGRLTEILRDLGEEPDAHRIARAIVAARPKTTGALADVVRAAMSAPRLRQIGLRINPATRTFQALRIFLNQELEQLDALLAAAPDLLAVGGRLAIITFHSLEDRRVKQAFAARARVPQPPPGVPVTAADLPRPRFAVPHALRHGLTPGDAELAANPRSRSSRLRVLERLSP
jgi:16S rRNA (cytosine1402-N4)-methyltransferase